MKQEKPYAQEFTSEEEAQLKEIAQGMVESLRKETGNNNEAPVDKS